MAVQDKLVTNAGLRAAYDNLNGKYTEVKADLENLDVGLTDTQKAALLACFRNVAWITTDGEDYYDALENALYEIPIASITAVYNPGSNIIYTEDSLNDLKQYITVTALYETGASAIVTDYALTGTLAEGNNTITISYRGKSTTITVNVVDYYNQYLWSLGTNLIKITGNTTNSNSYNGIVTNRNATMQNIRRSFVVEKGLSPYSAHDTGNPTNYYPIPVPPNAVKVTCSITAAQRDLVGYLMQYSESTGKYTLISQSSWSTGTFVLTFSKSSNQFLVLASRYNAAGDAYSEEPTALTVQFE